MPITSTMGTERKYVRARLVLVVALFAVVTVVRFNIRAGDFDGIALLYAAPIGLLAATCGIWAGVAAAAVTLGLFSAWAAARGIDVGIVGYLTRAVGLAVFGGFAGLVAERQARHERATTRWFEMSNDLLVEADLHGYFTRVNGQWERCLGWTPEEMLSRPMLDFVHPDDREATAAQGNRLDRTPGEVVNFENRYRAKDGSWHWLLWNSRSDGQRKYAVARDISKRKAFEEQRERLFDEIEQLSLTDALTGLPNRRSWEDEVHQVLTRARRSGSGLTLAMADLDHFKAFNDTHGHLAGDDLLVQVAMRWRQVVRTTDFLARYGGEEFALLLPDCPPEEAERLLDRLRAATPGAQTCSVGIAHWDGVEDAHTLLSRADAALYEAKRVGRDRVVTST